MDEEVITWNLKGPKRFKKRKELNALIKNNIKYKGLTNGGSNSIDMYNISSNNSARRLLKGATVNSSSTENENEQYFFSANKQIIKERNKNFYCRLFQISLVACVIIFALLFVTVLMFSYSKFNNVISELKQEVKQQNSETGKTIDSLKTKMSEYDKMFQLLKKNTSQSSIPPSSSSLSSKNDKRRRRRRQVNTLNTSDKRA